MVGQGVGLQGVRGSRVGLEGLRGSRGRPTGSQGVKGASMGSLCAIGLVLMIHKACMPVYMNSGKIVAGPVDGWTGKTKVLQEVLADLKS